MPTKNPRYIPWRVTCTGTLQGQGMCICVGMHEHIYMNSCNGLSSAPVRLYIYIYKWLFIIPNAAIVVLTGEVGKFGKNPIFVRQFVTPSICSMICAFDYLFTYASVLGATSMFVHGQNYVWLVDRQLCIAYYKHYNRTCLGKVSSYLFINIVHLDHARWHF